MWAHTRRWALLAWWRKEAEDFLAWRERAVGRVLVYTDSQTCANTQHTSPCDEVMPPSPRGVNAETWSSPMRARGSANEKVVPRSTSKHIRHGYAVAVAPVCGESSLVTFCSFLHPSMEIIGIMGGAGPESDGDGADVRATESGLAAIVLATPSWACPRRKGGGGWSTFLAPLLVALPFDAGGRRWVFERREFMRQVECMRISEHWLGSRVRGQSGTLRAAIISMDDPLFFFVACFGAPRYHIRKTSIY
jgi:hypothetical protein